jgi:hypothetical protein
MDELVEFYIKIYNDVFTKEKPLTYQKYFFCEIAAVEMSPYKDKLDIIFAYNFVNGTSKVLQYH